MPPVPVLSASVIPSTLESPGKFMQMQVLRPHPRFLSQNPWGRGCPVTHLFNPPRWFLCILTLLDSPQSSLGPWTNARWLFPCILWLYTFYQTHHRAVGKGTKLKINAAFPGRCVAQRLEHHPEPGALPSCWAKEEGLALAHLFSDRWEGLSGFL